MGLQYLSEEASAPTSPASGQVVLYPKTDHFLYWKDSTGAVRTVIHTTGTLTSGRVPYATTGGVLTDASNLTFDGTTLTANTIGAFTLAGTVAGGGNQINNIIIGAVTPLAGSFTTISASGAVSFGTAPYALSQQLSVNRNAVGKVTIAYITNSNTPGTITGLFVNVNSDTPGVYLNADGSAGAPMYLQVGAVTVCTLNAGMQIGAPTGGDKGAGTVNAAAAYYANGTAGVASFGPSAVSSITVKNGIITAIS